MINQNKESRVSSQPKHFVGFAGTAGIGKSTLAHIVSEYFNGVVIPYAKPLKESLVALTGLSMDHYTNIDLKEKIIPGLDKTPRQLMQLMGTEFARNMIDYDFWLWRMRHAISENSNRHIFIDDIRFNNEADLVRDNGGVIIHLIRNYEQVTEEIDHASEIPIKKYKYDLIYDIKTHTPEVSAAHVIDMLRRYQK